MTDQENTKLVAEGGALVVDENVPEHDREADVVVEEAPEQPEVVVEGRDYRVEGNDISGYVGVDPEYMTYANETEKPLNTAQEQWDLGLLDHLEGNMDDEEKKESEVDADADAEANAEEEEAADETKSDETPPAPAPAHNPPSNVPGVLTPTVQ